MRNSLVIKGIPELENESWEQSKHAVGNLLGPLLHENPLNIADGIERAHRGGEKRQNKPRNIYTRFYCSENVKYYNTKIRELNMRKATDVTCSLQFSKKLTIRRNNAMMERNNLKSSGKIVSGYVEFPADLMIKKPGSTRYELCEKF